MYFSPEREDTSAESIRILDERTHTLKAYEDQGAIKVGIDVEEKSKPNEQFLLNSSSDLLHKIFTSEEIVYSCTRNYPEESLLGIFCAKEAIIKIYNELSLTDIAITHCKDGKPIALIKDCVHDSLNLSISHSHDTVVAVAISVDNIRINKQLNIKNVQNI